MLVEDLALAARPARALCPQRRQPRRDLHADQRVRFVGGVPAGHQEPPGEVDVLGGHAGVVAADREDALAAEHPEHPRDDADPARQRLLRRIRPMIDAASSTCIALISRVAIGDVRRARDRRHQRGLVHPRGQAAQGVGHHMGVGVSDDDELVYGHGRSRC